MKEKNEFIIFSPTGKVPEDVIYAIKSGDDVSVCVDGNFAILLLLFMEIVKGIFPKDESMQQKFSDILNDYLNSL